MFLVLIALPILGILFLLNNMYVWTLINISAEDRQRMLTNISTSVDNEVQQRMLAAINVAVDIETLSLANRWHSATEAIPRSIFDIEMRSRLSQPILLINGCEAIVFYFKNSNNVYVLGDNTVPVLTAEHARNTPWFKKAIQNPGRMIVDSSLIEEGQGASLTFAIHPSTIISNNQVDVIYFRFNINFINDFGLNQGDTIIAGADGSIIYCALGYRLGLHLDHFPLLRDSQPSSVINIEGTQKLITTATAPRTNWQIISIDSYNQIARQVQGVTFYAYIAGGLYLLFFVVFSLLFYRKIIRPTLMLELQAMQYQITPHFIINTINSIKIMAVISRQKNIEKMTEAFMRLLSAVLGKKGTESSTKEEIENIKHYIHIMKVRFGDKFIVEYDIQPEIEELRILSFLLQPIVENSIIHGFNEKEFGGKINIKGYCKKDGKENRLIFEVCDNGSGMTPQKARELLLQQQGFGKGFLSMGLYNVNRRIKLNYGRAYGLSIESKPDQCTCVTFELPVIINQFLNSADEKP